MVVARFLFYTLCCAILLVALSLVVVGGLGVLRVAVKWCLDVDCLDCIKRVKEWVAYVDNK